MKKLFLLLVIILSCSGYACSCDSPYPVKESFNDAKEVFIAKIIRIDSTHLSDYGQKIYLYDVKIIHFFKKDPHNRSEEIRTFFYRNSIGGCDFEFISGEKYLIYEANGEMNPQKSMNYASKCSRTALLTRVDKKEINELENLSNTSIKATLNIDDTTGVSSKEYSDVTTMILDAEKALELNKYLIIISTVLCITTLVFIILYLKTKKKLNRF